MRNKSFKLEQTILNIVGYTKLIVIGGYNAELGYLMSSVEVIDLENPSNKCNLIADYPVDDTGMTVGLIDGLIKSCGSMEDKDDCYDYNPATNSWITSTSLINARDFPRSSFIDGIWLVSGDNTGPENVPQTNNRNVDVNGI